MRCVEMERLLTVLKLVKPQSDIEDLITSKDLYGQGFLDSLDIIQIVEEINEEFGIEIGGRNMTRNDFLTVESMYEMIKRHGGK